MIHLTGEIDPLSLWEWSVWLAGTMGCHHGNVIFWTDKVWV